MKTKKRLSSAVRMKAAGWHPLQVWLSPEQRQLIESAADVKGMFVAEFIRVIAVKEAEKILRKIPKSA